MVIGVPLCSHWPLLPFKLVCFSDSPLETDSAPVHLTCSQGGELTQETDSCLSKITEFGFVDFFFFFFFFKPAYILFYVFFFLHFANPTPSPPFFLVVLWIWQVLVVSKRTKQRCMIISGFLEGVVNGAHPSPSVGWAGSYWVTSCTACLHGDLHVFFSPLHPLSVTVYQCVYWVSATCQVQLSTL